MKTTLNKILDYFKLYHLVCDCGTSLRFYTLKGALAWLPYAGKVAVIGKRSKVIMSRVWGF